MRGRISIRLLFFVRETMKRRHGDGGSHIKTRLRDAQTAAVEGDAAIGR